MSVRRRRRVWGTIHVHVRVRDWQRLPGDNAVSALPARIRRKARAASQRLCSGRQWLRHHRPRRHPHCDHCARRGQRKARQPPVGVVAAEVSQPGARGQWCACMAPRSAGRSPGAVHTAEDALRSSASCVSTCGPTAWVCRCGATCRVRRFVGGHTSAWRDATTTPVVAVGRPATSLTP